MSLACVDFSSKLNSLIILLSQIKQHEILSPTTKNLTFKVCAPF